MSETVGHSSIPESYGEVMALIGSVVSPYPVQDIRGKEEGGWEIGSVVGCFDARITPFNLPMDTTKRLRIGTLVRGRVIGTVEEGDGVTILVRSINPFRKGIYGFYIQPKPQEADGPDMGDPARAYEVWEGPASWPDRAEIPWGMHLLNDSKARLSDTHTREELMRTLQRHAAHRAR